MADKTQESPVEEAVDNKRVLLTQIAQGIANVQGGQPQGATLVAALDSVEALRAKLEAELYPEAE